MSLGTNCRTDLGSCGCQCSLGLEKGGGAVTDPSTLRRGLLEGAYSVGAVVFGLSSLRKHPGLPIITVNVDIFVCVQLFSDLRK